MIRFGGPACCTYSVSFCLFYPPCTGMHINFLLWLHHHFLRLAVRQHHVLLHLCIVQSLSRFLVMLISVIYAGPLFIGHLSQAFVFITCLAVVTFGFIFQVSVFLLHCAFRVVHKKRDPTNLAWSL